MTSEDAVSRLHATLALRDAPEAVTVLVGRALFPDLARRVEVRLRAVVDASLQLSW